MNDYWDDDSQYDQVADELKQAFRESVKDEIKNRIKKLGMQAVFDAITKYRTARFLSLIHI